MYLVSTYYRGAMNVSDMRAFTSKKKAKEHWDELLKEEHPALGTSGIRAYKMHEDKKPTLLRTEKHWEQA